MKLKIVLRVQLLESIYTKYISVKEGNYHLSENNIKIL